MEHTLNTLIRFSSKGSDDVKKRKLQSFHYDHYGHVITCNSHVLFATKKPWDITKAGRAFSIAEYEKGFFTEAKEAFPDWQDVIPQDSARRITVHIPEWFDLFEQEDRSATFVLDYSDKTKPFLKLGASLGQTNLAFNARYLSCFAGEQVSFLITSPLSPVIVVQSESQLDPLSSHFKEDVLKEEWFYVLMPIKLDEEALDEVYI